MNIPTFINEYGFETAIKPWHRPDLVYWEPMELPPWAKQEPTSFIEQCCCYGGFGGSSTYFQAAAPVPEIGTGLMMAVGVIMIVLVKKWKTK